MPIFHLSPEAKTHVIRKKSFRSFRLAIDYLETDVPHKMQKNGFKTQTMIFWKAIKQKWRSTGWGIKIVRLIFFNNFFINQCIKKRKKTTNSLQNFKQERNLNFKIIALRSYYAVDSLPKIFAAGT